MNKFGFIKKNYFLNVLFKFLKLYFNVDKNVF